jgi:hypothetical protein
MSSVLTEDNTDGTGTDDDSFLQVLQASVWNTKGSGVSTTIPEPQDVKATFPRSFVIIDRRV